MKIYRNILLTIIFLTVTAAFSSLLAQTSIPKAQPTGKLKGVVVDPGDAVVVYARIVIEGKNFKRKVKTNEAGEYEVALPIGQYEIFAEMDGFHSSKRRKLCVVENKIIERNFTLEGVRQDVDHP